MNLFILVIFGVMFIFDQTYSYVIMKNNDVDSRKQFNNYKRFEVRKRADDEDSKNSNGENYRQSPDTMNFQSIDERPTGDSIQGVDKKDVDSVVIAIDTGAKGGASTPPSKPDMIDKLEDVIKTIVKSGNSGDGPLMRARQEYDLQPKVVQLRKGQPSIKYDINSNSLVKALDKLLSSPVVRRYADDIGKKAAAVFRVLNEEIYRKNNVLPYNMN